MVITAVLAMEYPTVAKFSYNWNWQLLRDSRRCWLSTISTFTYLFDKQSVKAKRKGQDKEDTNQRDFEETLQNICEHDDIDAQKGEFSHIGQQVEPGTGHWNGTYLPLPAQSDARLALTAGEVKNKQNGRHIT